MQEKKAQNTRNLLIGLFSIVPLIFFPIVQDPTQTPIFLYLSIILIIALFLSTPTSFKVNKILLLAFSGLILIGVLSQVFIIFNSESVLYFSKMIYIVLCFFTLSFLLENKTLKSKDLQITLIVSALFYCVLGYYEFFKFYSSDKPFSGLYSVQAHIGHKNLLSIYLVSIAPIMIHRAIKAKTLLFKTGYNLLIILSCTLVFLVQSRVGIIGVFILLLLRLVYVVCFSFKKRTILISSVISIVFLVLLFVFKNNIHAYPVVDRVLSIVNLSDKKEENQKSIDERIVLWEKTLSLIADKPILGYGVGQWKFHILSKDINKTKAKFGNIIFLHPHNDFLSVASEYGVVGVLLFALLFLYPIAILSISKNRKSNFYMISGLLLFLVLCQFDFPKERPQHLFVLASYLSLFNFKTSLNKLKISTPFFKKLSQVLLIGLILFFIYRYFAEIMMARMSYQRVKGEHFEVIKTSKNLSSMGIDYDMVSCPVAFYDGEANFLLGNVFDAKTSFLKSLSKSPYHLYSWNNFGDVYHYLNDSTESLKCWKKSLLIANDFLEPRINLSLYYLNKQDYKNSIKNIQIEYEEENIIKYKDALLNILKANINHNSKYNEPLLKNEVKALLNSDGRILWLYYNYCENKSDFFTQLTNELLYKLNTQDKKISNKEFEILKAKYL